MTGGAWGRVDSISRRVFSESAKGIQGVFEGIRISGRVFRVWDITEVGVFHHFLQ